MGPTPTKKSVSRALALVDKSVAGDEEDGGWRSKLGLSNTEQLKVDDIYSSSDDGAKESHVSHGAPQASSTPYNKNLSEIVPRGRGRSRGSTRGLGAKARGTGSVKSAQGRGARGARGSSAASKVGKHQSLTTDSENILPVQPKHGKKDTKTKTDASMEIKKKVVKKA